MNNPEENKIPSMAKFAITYGKMYISVYVVHYRSLDMHKIHVLHHTSVTDAMEHIKKELSHPDYPALQWEIKVVCDGFLSPIFEDDINYLIEYEKKKAENA